MCLSLKVWIRWPVCNSKVHLITLIGHHSADSVPAATLSIFSSKRHPLFARGRGAIMYQKLDNPRPLTGHGNNPAGTAEKFTQ